MTQELDQTVLEAFLVSAYSAEQSTTTDLDTDFALGSSSLVG